MLTLILAALVAVGIGSVGQAAAAPGDMSGFLAARGPAATEAFDAIIASNYSAPELERLRTLGDELTGNGTPRAQRIGMQLNRVRLGAGGLARLAGPIGLATGGFMIGWEIGGALGDWLGLRPKKLTDPVGSNWDPYLEHSMGSTLDPAESAMCNAWHPVHGGHLGVPVPAAPGMVVKPSPSRSCRVYHPDWLQLEFRPSEIDSTDWNTLQQIKTLPGVQFVPAEQAPACLAGAFGPHVECPGGPGVVAVMPFDDTTFEDIHGPMQASVAAALGLSQQADTTRQVSTVVPTPLPADVRTRAITEIEKPENADAAQWVRWAIDPESEEDPMVTRLPAPDPGETADAYRARLEAQGWLGVVITVRPEGEYDPRFGPNEVVSVNPAPGTEADPATRPVNVVANGPDAPPPGVTPGSGVSDPACAMQKPDVDWNKLRVTCDGRFPCTIWTWIADAIGTGPPTTPEWDIEFPGAGQHTISLAGFDGGMNIIRTMLGWSGALLMVWWLGRSLLGLGNKEPD